MARKKIQHALHIKSRTHGSSNEISFSVLDAAREARDAEEGDRRDGGLTGGVPLFTLGKGKKPPSTPVKGQHIILAGDSSLPKASRSRTAEGPAPAAPASAKSRRLPAILSVLVIGCACVALALTVGQTLLQVNVRQGDYRDQLREQVGVVNRCDETLIPFDTLVMEQYDKNRFSPQAGKRSLPSFDELTEAYRAVVGDIAPSRTQLEEALAAIEALQPSLSENRDQEAAHQAVTAARARLNMLDSGVALIDESLMATKAFTDARDGWRKIIDADAAAREATALLAAMTKENVEESCTKSTQAADLLSEAASLLSRAQENYPGLDLQRFIDYALKREEAQRAAISADQAYLSRDKELLEQENDRYNGLEEEAAALAQEMGADPDERVAEFYQASIEKDAQSYEGERVKAGNADTFLRDYLGSAAE